VKSHTSSICSIAQLYQFHGFHRYAFLSSLSSAFSFCGPKAAKSYFSDPQKKAKISCRPSRLNSFLAKMFFLADHFNDGPEHKSSS